MRIINYKLLLILVASVAVLTGGLFFLHYLQSGRIASALLWQANRAKDKGDLKKTVHFLKRYLEFEPNDLEERAYLGRTLADPKLAKTDPAREKALFVLEQVVARDPDRQDLLRPLARIAIELRKYDLAWPHLQILEKNCPRDGEAQSLLGQWHEAKEKYTRAESCYRMAVAAAPRRAEYALRLAELLRQRQGKPEEARRVVAEAQKHSPDHVGLILMGAELAPAGQRARARADLVAGLQLHPKEPQLYQALARIEILDNRRGRAEQWLRNGLGAVPGADCTGLRWTLAHLLLDGNRPADANIEIAALRRANLAPGAIDYLLARVDICRGSWAKAARALEGVRPKLERSFDLAAQLNVFLGQCYEHLDDPIRRLGAYEQAVALDSQSVAARLGLASARWSLGHLDLAIKDYREAMRLPDANITPAAWAQYLRSLMARGRQQGEVDWKEVETAWTQAEIKYPRAVELILVRADILIGQNRSNDAWDLLFIAKNDRPRELALRTALTALAQARGQLDKARLILEEAERDLPGKVELMVARARYLFALKGNAAAADIEKLAESQAKLSEEDRAAQMTGLADACYRMGLVAETARYLNRAAALPRSQNDLRLRLRLFDLALQMEDAAALQRILGQMRQIEGEGGAWWQFASASRLVWQARQKGADKDRLLKEAGQVLDRVHVLRPQWSAVHMARAEIAELRGDPNEARTYYKLAMAEGGESNRAVTRQLIQLGLAQAANGERSPEAEQKLRLAVELDNADPEAWIALLKYLAATDRLKEAEAALTRADQRLTDPLALAQCYEAVGQLDRAHRQFLKVHENRQNNAAAIRAVASFYMRNNLPRAAEPHLRGLINRKIAKTEADVAWAKRALAMVLADGSDYPRFLEALALVGLSLDGSGQVVETPFPFPAERDEYQRARARVLAAHPSRSLRARSIQLLEDLGGRHPLLPDDQLLLAQLYESAGKDGWPRAKETLAALVAGHPRDPIYLAHFVRSLLEHQETREASRLAARLEELEKTRNLEMGTFGSTELIARALEQSGQGEKALALLRIHADGKSDRPSRILAYAAALARLNHLGDALDQCERAGKIGRPEIAIGACLAFLRAAQPTPEQYERVELMLEEARKKKPAQATDLTLQIQLAELHDLRGQYDDAEVLYRKVLRADAGNVMALNNLAWLLAQRKGRGDEALPLIQKAIERLGPRPELLDTQAITHLARRRGDLAIVDLKTASKEAPSAARYFNLARAYHLANNAGAALEAFQKARAAGLKPDRLHPIERAAYDKIASDLKRVE